ncbi:DUF4124 domain-containing protein [Pseudohaliea sp.]|uniref:DUF4124 domain-containing protein n=1 Tax=Pseudohaliea sp. TaxID=2740289 RepID=UPI0032ECA634
MIRQSCSATLIAVLAVLLAMPATAASSTYYRWKDDQGNLVMSDRPPADSSIEFETVGPDGSLRRPPAADEGSAVSTPGAGSGTAAAREEGGAQAATPSSSPPPDPELCAQARANLRTLESAARIRMQGEDGEMRFLDDEEREAQRQEALRAIEAHCEP